MVVSAPLRWQWGTVNGFDDDVVTLVVEGLSYSPCFILTTLKLGDPFR